jgi:hypothetical protein
LLEGGGIEFASPVQLLFPGLSSNSELEEGQQKSHQRRFETDSSDDDLPLGLFQVCLCRNLGVCTVDDFNEGFGLLFAYANLLETPDGLMGIYQHSASMSVYEE